MKITIGLRRRKEPIKEFKELGEAMMEFKKAILEAYIKSPMGRLTIWILERWVSMQVWSKQAVCKTVLSQVRRFKSSLTHKINKRIKSRK